MQKNSNQISISGTLFQIAHTLSHACPWVEQMGRKEYLQLSVEDFVLLTSQLPVTNLPEKMNHEYPVQTSLTESGWRTVQKEYKIDYLMVFCGRVYQFTKRGFDFADPNRYYGAGAQILVPARK